MLHNIEKINPKIITLLTEFKKILKQLYGTNLSKLIIYGSYVHGEEKNDSDVDIAIILKKIDNP
ncbi:MAG: nucleotidyltransferase domain-containing protein, partial [Candidatus Lokiarchaeota archaeon]|nr:nucleotidyltransferase domain-containing protein [Candidatus Lokiarchaeota archaeon]